MTSHCITWHDTTQAITSHQMTWPSHDLTPEQTSRHQNTSLQSTKHHHHGRAEGSFTAKKWFGHRAGRSPCAHSIGKFFLCYIVLFLLETSAPGLSGHYWYMFNIFSIDMYSIMFSAQYLFLSLTTGVSCLLGPSPRRRWLSLCVWKIVVCHFNQLWGLSATVGLVEWEIILLIERKSG